ncbi:Rieske 2Fe-2S domain-containing protein [Streptomyces sp. BA2]|uniref:Rieske 2Fe-2S domain-containing protein n=1 Tax=Streptomyces sp. BA2 TaxID=436595 RepID=UPI00132645E1|nr:Rieske 2Fe-2S domain-containing protein [Streptomyces sp. BA2]MWA08351.1 Rieske 2Fe-2S domain-containing protein [Streptomyces sp. BA2]
MRNTGRSPTEQLAHLPWRQTVYVPRYRRPRRDRRRGAEALAGDAVVPALPYPSGWFCAGLSRDWVSGAVRTVLFMGEDIVVYRTRDGRLRATKAFCPHMGAHLGVGGRVDGELLVCPFHGFAFGLDGRCERTPYGTPPRATLALLHVREAHGLVWLWHHPSRQPQWELPPLPGIGLRPVLRAKQIELASHPQEILENALDYGHLLPVHGNLVEEITAPHSDGPFLRLSVRLRRRIPLLGRYVGHGQLTFTYIGLGAMYSHVDFSRYGFHVIGWMLPLPVAPWRTHYRMAATVTAVGPLHRLDRTLGRLITRTLSRLMVAWFFHDTRADHPIWHHKQYQPHPALNQADGPIGTYRHWARQFYPPHPSLTKPRSPSEPAPSP